MAPLSRVLRLAKLQIDRLCPRLAPGNILTLQPPLVLHWYLPNYDRHKRNTNGFGLFSFRSPLLREYLRLRAFFSFPLRTEMFPFRRFAPRPCGRVCRFNIGKGFPIRTSRDQRLLTTSPRLFAGTPRPSSPLTPKASAIRL